MRKNINKIVAFAIGINVMSGSIMPVFAADSNQTTTSEVNQVTSSTANTALNISSAANVQNQVKKTPVLTLKEAIDAAINNSDKLALKSKEIRLYEDKADIQEELDDLQGSDDDFPYDKLELTIKQTKEQKEYTEDQIAEDITNKYNNIVLMQNTLNKLKKQIEIQTRDNENAKFKKSLGMSISLDISKAEIELQKLKNSEKAQQDQLKNAQDYFKIITERDINNYVLEQDQEYKEFRIEGSLDEYFDNVVDKYYKYDNKLFEMTKDNLKDNDVDRPSSNDKPNKDDSRFQKDITDVDGNVTGKEFDSKAYDAAEQTYVGLWNDFGNYLQNKYNLSSSKVSLDEKKKNLKKGLEESYASLASMENDINVAKSNIDVKNKELSIAKLKYDEGLIIKINYDKQILDYEDLETNLRSSINSYNKLKNQIQKPWLLSSSAS
jgi:hypothetical protein